MNDNIRSIIPTIYEEIGSDGENDSERLLGYYNDCTLEEKDVVNNVLIYLCGWSFPTILEKCGVTVAKQKNQ